MEKMQQAKISRVDLSTTEISQLLQTLVYDHMIEIFGENHHDALFIAARRVTPMCEFKWWDVLETDFQYRRIKFEDGVELAAHEPHFHTE
jgi:hypothetical protein